MPIDIPVRREDLGKLLHLLAKRFLFELDPRGMLIVADCAWEQEFGG